MSRLTSELELPDEEPTVRARPLPRGDDRRLIQMLQTLTRPVADLVLEYLLCDDACQVPL